MGQAHTDRKDTISSLEEHGLSRERDAEAQTHRCLGRRLPGDKRGQRAEGAHSTVVKTGFWILIQLHHLLPMGPWASHSVFQEVSFLTCTMETEWKAI